MANNYHCCHWRSFLNNGLYAALSLVTVKVTLWGRHRPKTNRPETLTDDVYRTGSPMMVIECVIAVFRGSEKPKYKHDVQPHSGVAGQSADHEVKVHQRSTVSQRLESVINH